jgi:phosphatidylglycerol:prolipoprotein diacylglycerol transferase
VIDITPSPIALSIGPLDIHWYGIAYAVGIAAAYLVIQREARWRNLDVGLLPNATVIVAIAALIGGRLYHVIDRNQELYGTSTNLPWGIAIQCQYRTQGYPCPPGSDPLATLGQHFQPMFLYESLSGLLGALALIWLARRFASRLRSGDLLLVFLIWFGAVRFAVESLKADNWRLFGFPTAQIVATITVLGAAAILVARHSRQSHGGSAQTVPVE